VQLPIQIVALHWSEFLRSRARCGLRGVKLVVSDAHEGLEAAITKVLGATWRRCRVCIMRHAIAYAGKTRRRIVAAWIGTVFVQDDAEAARKQWRHVADRRRGSVIANSERRRTVIPTEAGR
jgi:putative transposase